MAGYARPILSMVTFPKKLTIFSNVPLSLESLADNIVSCAASILKVVTG